MWRKQGTEANDLNQDGALEFFQWWNCSNKDALQSDEVVMLAVRKRTEIKELVLDAADREQF